MVGNGRRAARIASTSAPQPSVTIGDDSDRRINTRPSRVAPRAERIIGVGATGVGLVTVASDTETLYERPALT